jgi:26S proteasome regulatory subunit (ATPase 3-interacting protein)
VRKQEYDELQSQLKELNLEVKKLTAEPTNDEIDEQITKLEAEYETLSKKVIDLESKQKNAISEEDMKKIEVKVKEYQLEWKRRKRGCMDMVNAVSENMDKNRKDFMEDVGIETDEEFNVV